MTYIEKLRTVQLNDPLIASELERLCNEKGGFLTYPEFLQVTQHGDNGVHKKYRAHGHTHVEKRWGKAIALLAKSHGYTNLIEFASGDGSLGLSVVKESIANGHTVNWAGVEIEPELTAKTKTKFVESELEDRFSVYSSLDQIDLSGRNLLIFPYALDSLSPQIFVRSGENNTFDSILGLSIKQWKLSEVILTEKELASRGISFSDGVYHDQTSISFDISEWKSCYQGQRAYVPIEAFQLLHKTFSRMGEGSSAIIIDEYARNPIYRSLGSVNPVKQLWPIRERYDIPEYENAQNGVLYHPFCLDTLNQFLSISGFEEIKTNSEKEYAAEITGKSIYRDPREVPLCSATIAFNKTSQKLSNVIPLYFKLDRPSPD